jgi:hypothetical protein
VPTPPAAEGDFHRAIIERALGHMEAARADLEQALAINPHFSILHAPEARSSLAPLGPAGGLHVASN